MARRHRDCLQYVWRAVVTRTWPSGATITQYHGPFFAKGQATRSATRHYNATTEYTIQRSPLVWEDVETRGTHDRET